MSTHAALQIGRLRALARMRDAASARLASEALLSELDVTRAGLPPQSLLFVSRFDVAVPWGALSRLPDFELRERVRASTSARLRDIAERAVHPARGGVATDATAVVFADEAELLACLAKDGLNDQLHRWWWRALLRRGWPDWTLEFVKRPHAVPAALTLLEQMALRERAVVTLKTRVELVDLVRSESVPSRSAAFATASLSMGEAVRCDDEPTRSDRTMFVGGIEPSDEAVVLARRDFAQSGYIGSALGPDGAGDLRGADGATATIRHGAAVAAAAADRSPEPARETMPAVWSDQSPFEPPATSVGVAPRLKEVSTGAGANWGAPVGVARIEIALPCVDEHSSGVEAAAFIHGGQPEAVSADVSASSSTGVAWHLATSTSVQCAGRAQVEDRQGPGPERGVQPVRTRWGGLFFLVNVLLAQGLYPDFTRPRDRGFPIPMWRLLALIGRRLIGRRFCADPIWSMLLALDEAWVGNPEQPLETFWSPPNGTLEPRFQARLTAPAHRHEPEPVVHWVGTFVAWLRRSSADQLGWTVGQVGRRLAAIPAAVWITPGAMVVTMPLDALPVELRLAGFDRDPGFLPTTSRTLRFVFE